VTDLSVCFIRSHALSVTVSWYLPLSNSITQRNKSKKKDLLYYAEKTGNEELNIFEEISLKN
jgi:hypothetical protein